MREQLLWLEAVLDTEQKDNLSYCTALKAQPATENRTTHSLNDTRRSSYNMGDETESRGLVLCETSWNRLENAQEQRERIRDMFRNERNI